MVKYSSALVAKRVLCVDVVNKPLDKCSMVKYSSALVIKMYLVRQFFGLFYALPLCHPCGWRGESHSISCFYGFLLLDTIIYIVFSDVFVSYKVHKKC